MKKQVLLILKPSPARESLTQLLTEQGFEIQSQPSTFRAVSSLAKRPCEAVILGLDDLLEEEIEVVRVIREECPGVFLLVTFTAINRRKAQSSLEMGADAYALEPLRPEEVAAMLRRLSGVSRPAAAEPAAPLRAEPAFEPASPEPTGPVPKAAVQRPAHVEKTGPTVEKTGSDVEKSAPHVEKRGPSAPPPRASEPKDQGIPAPQPPATTVLSEVSADRLASLRKLGASVAHEINNPLTTLSGWIQLLLKKANGNQDLRRTLVNMKEEADRIADVVRQLSAISEPDLAGRGPVDINTLADAIVDAFVGMNGNAGIRVKKIFTAAPPAVKADRDLLVRAVCDLLTSSYLNLGNSGSLVFTTTATSDAVEFRVYEPGSQVCLDGLKRGMSSVDLGESEKIGQDLMLARCQEIISSHGGSFTADCDPREGLNFAVRLPRAGERS
jgi:DNA-binding NarL/FixJ family response regulator